MNKKILLAGAVTIACLCSNAQTIQTIPQNVEVATYDSTQNIDPDKLRTLKGQEAIIVDVDNFYPTKIRSQFIKHISEKYLGSSFTINNIEKNTDGSVWIEFKSEAKTVYLRFSGSDFEHQPFITKAYLEKEKQLYKGLSYSSNTNYDFVDVNTGKTVNIKPKMTFTIIDVRIIQDQKSRLVPSYILHSADGVDINVPLPNFAFIESNSSLAQFIQIKK